MLSSKHIRKYKTDSADGAIRETVYIIQFDYSFFSPFHLNLSIKWIVYSQHTMVFPEEAGRIITVYCTALIKEVQMYDFIFF